MAKRISIINFKGGVGKTTLAFHLGTGISRQDEARVLLIDMDHQSSLSIVCLGADKWQQSVDDRHTVDQIFRPFVGQRTELPGREVILQSPMKNVNASYNSMDILPSSLQLDDVEIELTATHQGNAIQSEWNKRTLMCRWIEETGIDKEYDYIIFDCPPATKIVSQNAIAASHGYVVPVVPEAVMERGAPHLVGMMQSGIDSKLNGIAQFGEPRTVHVSDTKLIGLVITRIQRARGGFTNDHRQHLSSLERLWKDALMKPYIYQGAGVYEAISDGVPVDMRRHTQNVGGRGIDRQYDKLTDEVRRRIDAL